jgi:excisionase family DNA binding protein
MDGPILLYRTEAARLGIGDGTLNGLIAAGHIRAVRVGVSGIRVPKEECMRFALEGTGKRPSGFSRHARTVSESFRQALELACAAATLPGGPGVYYVGSDDVPGLVKIGVSRSIRQRVVHMQAGSPARLSLLAWTRGDYAAEQAEHQRWAAFRLRGEWFRLEGSLRDHVSALAAARGP